MNRRRVKGIYGGEWRYQFQYSNSKFGGYLYMLVVVTVDSNFQFQKVELIKAAMFVSMVYHIILYFKYPISVFYWYVINLYLKSYVYML
jgi:hypothetical protein